MRRVGVLIQFAESDPEGQARGAAFREELQKLGWSMGGDLQIDYRFAVSTEELARSAAAELLRAGRYAPTLQRRSWIRYFHFHAPALARASGQGDA